MPLSRLADRLVREEKRQFVEEEKRRHELWINFAALFFSNRGESTAPETKEEFEERRREEAKKNPTPPTEEQWRKQALARKSWESTREVYFTAALSEYHFEEAFHFGGHYFDKPPEQESESPKLDIDSMQTELEENNNMMRERRLRERGELEEAKEREHLSGKD